MQISPINLVYKQSYTDNGNPYRKSNLGKTLMVGSTAVTAISGIKNANIQEHKAAIKTGGMVVGLALMIGTFIDAVANRISSGLVDKVSLNTEETKQESSPLEHSLGTHQG